MEDSQTKIGLIAVYLYKYISLLDVELGDTQAFIFTLKNPKGFKPTRFLIQDSSRAINNLSWCGPEFGVGDIKVCDKCNQNDQNHINTTGIYGCMDSSVFLNCSGTGNEIHFIVLDYEVYTYTKN